MAQKKVSTGIDAPARPSTTTRTAKTSASAKQQHAKRLVNEWLNIAKGFDPDAYLNVICDLFDVLPSEIASDSRYPSHTKPRHLWWACIRQYGNWSYPVIADYVGREHSSVMHGIRNVPLDLIVAVHELANE